MKTNDVETINYFAYAHNSNTHVMKQRCSSAKFVGIGVLKNFKLVFRHYADIENEDNAECYGVIWNINVKDLKKLDYDEGIHKSYNRIPVTVDTENGPVRAMAYIMDPEHHNVKGTPEWYIKSVEEGYIEHGLPIAAIENAPKEVQYDQELTEAGGAPIYYWAYGMLCDPNNMHGATLVGVGELRNFSYKMYQFANVEPSTGDRVYGCLWEVDRRLLSYLDHMEGYPYMYDRRTYPVYCDGEKYPAEVYLMTPNTIKHVRGSIPSNGYIMSIRTGYIHAGVPLSQLYDAIDALDNDHYGYSQHSYYDDDSDSWQTNDYSYLDHDLDKYNHDENDDDNGDWDPNNRGHRSVQYETVSTGLGGGSAGNNGGSMVGGPTTYEQEHQYTKHHGHGQRRTMAMTYESLSKS
jgi:gamma-glutamylcyclotransferase (GGCT)/AIG2-like uncharacterized protein YtfP